MKENSLKNSDFIYICHYKTKQTDTTFDGERVHKIAKNVDTYTMSLSAPDTNLDVLGRRKHDKKSFLVSYAKVKVSDLLWETPNGFDEYRLKSWLET